MTAARKLSALPASPEKRCKWMLPIVVLVQVVCTGGVTPILRPAANMDVKAADAEAAQSALECLTAVASSSVEGRQVALQSGALEAMPTVFQVGCLTHIASTLADGSAHHLGLDEAAALLLTIDSGVLVRCCQWFTLCKPADAGTHPFPVPLCVAGVPAEWARQSRAACR